MNKILIKVLTWKIKRLNDIREWVEKALEKCYKALNNLGPGL